MDYVAFITGRATEIPRPPALPTARDLAVPAPLPEDPVTCIPPEVRQPDPARGRVYVAINESWRIVYQTPMQPIPETAYAWCQEGDEEWTYVGKSE